MTQLSPLALMELQVRTLYELDAFGRIVRRNSGAEPPVARPMPPFFMGRTHFGQRHPLAPGFAGKGGCGATNAGGRRTDRARLRKPTGNSIRCCTRCAATRARPRSTAARRSPSRKRSRAARHVRQLTREETHLLHPELAEWAVDFPSCEPAFGAFVHGVAVAICACARSARGGAEAGVETAASFRGMGLAPAATLAWAHAIRESGRVPFYSTSWENTASRTVARKLNLKLFGEDIHVS